MSATWLKNLGAITANGDSTTLGFAGATGGYVGKADTSLTADGYRHSFVGTIVVGAIGMWAASGEGIAYFRNAGTAPLAAQVATQRSAFLILAIGWNNIRGNDVGAAYTQAIHRAAIEALLDEVWAAAPWVRVVVTQMPPTKADDPAAWPDADNAACNAFITTWNGTTMPAMVAAYVALGRRIVAAGAYADPVRSDNVHPVDGATGYDLMAAPVVAALGALAA